MVLKYLHKFNYLEFNQNEAKAEEMDALARSNALASTQHGYIVPPTEFFKILYHGSLFFTNGAKIFVQIQLPSGCLKYSNTSKQRSS